MTSPQLPPGTLAQHSSSPEPGTQTGTNTATEQDHPATTDSHPPLTPLSDIAAAIARGRDPPSLQSNRPTSTATVSHATSTATANTPSTPTTAKSRLLSRTTSQRQLRLTSSITDVNAGDARPTDGLLPKVDETWKGNRDRLDSNILKVKADVDGVTLRLDSLEDSIASSNESLRVLREDMLYHQNHVQQAVENLRDSQTHLPQRQDPVLQDILATVHHLEEQQRDSHRILGDTRKAYNDLADLVSSQFLTRTEAQEAMSSLRTSISSVQAQQSPLPPLPPLTAIPAVASHVNAQPVTHTGTPKPSTTNIGAAVMTPSPFWSSTADNAFSHVELFPNSNSKGKRPAERGFDRGNVKRNKPDYSTVVHMGAMTSTNRPMDIVGKVLNTFNFPPIAVTFAKWVRGKYGFIEIHFRSRETAKEFVEILNACRVGDEGRLWGEIQKDDDDNDLHASYGAGPSTR
ncbi:hypothetical protein E1B28_011935 [Marasmius oreades]|uniref:Uncharacterized protein n=1 Tax=Marasmius oreades TaxID=181124 RepID=A0A9P7UN57_9AGAR|nr:uncharacterized protein E1B28_011935 [Marasmius oreades]KAG7087888.1 hypothetical protein E1B28_011935 [Marasmius oreades]